MNEERKVTSLSLTVFREVTDAHKAVDEALDIVAGLEAGKPLVRKETRNVLTDGIERVMTKLKDKYPDASYTFGPGHEPTDWELDVYCRGSLIEILELVEDVVMEEELSDHQFHVIPCGEEDLEEVLEGVSV